MSMIDTIRGEMVAAMKAKNKPRKETLSALLSALKNAAINKGSDLTEAEEGSVIKKEIKTIKETLETCPQDRADIIEEMTARIEVLSEFAPEEMSEDQINAAIDEVIKELAIEEPKPADKGKIMKAIQPRVKGKADGKLVNQLVTARLG